MSYQRTDWTKLRPGTKIAGFRDALLAGAVCASEWPLYFRHLSDFDDATRYLETWCGYIISRWSSPNACHQHAWKCYRITGRLSFHGGVAEDYTIPVEGRKSA